MFWPAVVARILVKAAGDIVSKYSYDFLVQIAVGFAMWIQMQLKS